MPHQCPSCGKQINENASACPGCGHSVPGPGIPSGARRQKPEMTRRVRMWYALFSIALVCVFGYLFVDNLPGKKPPIVERQPSVEMASMFMGQTYEQTTVPSRVEGSEIVVSLPALLEHKIIAFEYDNRSTIIPLIAFINNEGTLVTAFRMCEPCNSNLFSIEGTELLCGKCDTKWDLTTLEGLQGACMKYPPDPIPSRIEGNEIRISVDAVRNWKLRL